MAGDLIGRILGKAHRYLKEGDPRHRGPDPHIDGLPANFPGKSSVHEVEGLCIIKQIAVSNTGYDIFVCAPCKEADKCDVIFKWTDRVAGEQTYAEFMRRMQQQPKNKRILQNFVVDSRFQGALLEAIGQRMLFQEEMNRRHRQ